MADLDEGRQVKGFVGALTSFLVMGVIQFVSYFNLTINYRAIAARNVFVAMVTDAMAVAITYYIVRRIVRENDQYALLGMMLGGALAAYAGIMLTWEWQ